MAEEKDGALAPAEPQHTPLSEIVDKPRLTDASPVVDAPKAEAPVTPERKPKAEKPDDEARFRGLLNETLSEREKRQAAERERDQLKAWVAEQQQKLAADQERDPAPDMFKDPKGYSAWVERQVKRQAEAIARQQVDPLTSQLSQQTQVLSAMSVEKQIGPERWVKLNQWIEQQPPQFHNWCLNQRHPYDAALKEYRRQTTFERLGDDDLDTYEQKLREKILAELKGPVDPSDGIDEDDADFDAPKPKQNAPRSFASARSADPNRDATGRFAGPRPLGELVKEKDQRRKR